MDNGLVRPSGVNLTGRNMGERPTAPDLKRGKNGSKRKRIIVTASAVIVLVALLLGGLFWYQSNANASIDSSKYQAVFLTNGQVYFGKLQAPVNGYMKLTDIFYLQTKTTDATKDAAGNPQQATSQTASDVQLIKLGDEVHGPDDQMTISKDQVLFFENLKKDGKVTQSIASYQSKK
jgi:hypothetical protein